MFVKQHKTLRHQHLMQTDMDLTMGGKLSRTRSTKNTGYQKKHLSHYLLQTKSTVDWHGTNHGGQAQPDHIYVEKKTKK